MDKTLNYLALARKAGKAELGEEPVGAAARAGTAHLVLVASDASDHTWRRAKSFVSGTAQQCLRLPHSKDEMGFAIGRTCLAITAITDAALALALVQTLPPESCREPLAVLSQTVARQKQRQAEAKNHRKNIRKGKKK